jgi:hypothetical protein
MPFLKLNNDWSKLAQYYNQSFNNKPEVPSLKYTAFDDGLIRGGLFNATLSSVRDTARIGKFITSGNGGLFITKQIGLQLSNPLLEQLKPPPLLPISGQGFFNNINNTITNFINKRTPNQIYNLGLNTSTQIPINAFGGHIIRQGLLPIGGGGYLNGSTSNIKGYNYEKIVKENNDNKNNRLLGYLEKTIKDTSSSVSLNEYNGGAASIYGIGKTDIRTTDVRTMITGYNFGDIRLNGFKPLTNIEIYNAERINLKSNLKNQISGSLLYSNQNINLFNVNTNNILDYYNQLKSYPDQNTDFNNTDPKLSLLNGFPSYNVGYKKINSNSELYNKNNIGKKSRNVDSINTISIMKSKTFYDASIKNTLLNSDSNASQLFTYTSGSTEKVTTGYFGKDIIKFRIEFLNNNTNTNEILAFRAYIDDFSDGMQAKWNSYRYMGRGEDFYVYDGFTRDINVAFTIYAHSPEEMAPLYQKLNYLMSSFAPDYNSSNKMRGNIGYLTVGDYISQQPGVFMDIKLSGMLDTHWEINLDNNQYEVPKHIKVNLSFKPIHNFLPRRVSVTDGVNIDKAPFITPNSTSNKYLKNIK